MSNLPVLPSAANDLPASMRVVPLPTDATAQQLEQAVQLTLKLNGPGYKAREALSKADAAERDAFAVKLLADPGFNAVWLARFAGGLDLNTALLEQVLENTKRLDAREIAALTRKAKDAMTNVNRHLPKQPDPRFVKAWNDRKASARQIWDNISYLAKQVADCIGEYQSMMVDFEQIKALLFQKYNDMVTAIVMNQKLSENEDERTQKLIEDTALLEYVLLHLPERVKQLQADTSAPANQAEAKRILGLQPLVNKAIMTLNPLILAGNVSVDRYLQLSHMAGGRAVVLGLYLTAGIAAWESHVVQQIQTMHQMSIGLVTDDFANFIQMQISATSEGLVQVSQQYADFLSGWLLNAGTMQKVVDDIAKAHDILVAGADKLAVESNKVRSAVQDAKSQVDSGASKFTREMLAIAEKSATS